MEELGGSLVWRAATGLGPITSFLEADRDVFDHEEEGEDVVVWAQISHAQRVAKQKIRGRLTAVHRERLTVCGGGGNRHIGRRVWSACPL